MKFLISLFILLCSFSCFADTSGSGCRIDDKVYTQYLGEAYPYGTSNPKKKYYKSNGAYVPIYYGYGYNQHQGYKCGFINIYPSSSYYNGSENVPIPAENEITSTSFSACVTASSLGASPERDGDYVTFTYNRTSSCTVTPPANLPLDDYAWVAIIGAGLIGFYLLRNRLV